MKGIKNIFTTLLAGIIFGLFGLVIVLGLFTPEKDKFGNYTQPYQYWTSNEYFYSHF